MPTLKYFKECLEFPSDVPIADIPTISCLKLQGDFAEESENLYEACKEHGFFLLDLNSSEEGKQLLEDADIMYDVSVDIFNLGPEALMDYKLNMPKDLNGPAHTDTNLLPPIKLQAGWSAQDRLRQNGCYGTLYTQSGRGLAPGTLSALSPLEKPSATSLRLLMARPQPLNDKIISLGGHTDIGTIAMLFHVLGGFQVLPAGSENINSNWHYMRTVPGCALINIGDSLVEWTGGLLRSNLHRVVTPPGKQANCIRRSLAYLIRPNHNGSMRRLQSNVIRPLAKNEEIETRSVDEWAAWRAQQVIEGKMRPQTRGGRPFSMGNTMIAH
ncbi:hypothetical protein BCON_0323g00130 [Botryotinia convoluta]|uniref:Isopenicillin N synthase-like Fe(2+) 2OG dioxygenase domain-containing protein n=1 Tax=Botryotinia convoluta TaxID=54673 RepID=A0A4Z1HNE7_9HELO|nr:hypothetical protein BCON_0323g00130 [Botryotinia convoluta]